MKIKNIQLKIIKRALVAGRSTVVYGGGKEVHCLSTGTAVCVRQEGAKRKVPGMDR